MSVTIDVVVPSYRRADQLAQCLKGLERQECRPQNVVVVLRTADEISRRVVNQRREAMDNLVLAFIEEPGVLAAMTAGLRKTTSEIVAFTDDDAVPRSDWIASLIMAFSDWSVGGVGGRDIIPSQDKPLVTDVGRLRWNGKLSGPHHLGKGGPRDVDVLKGVNMAFRVEALALPASDLLRGSGAQVDWEHVTCAWARRHGWRLRYDPGIVVDHNPGIRYDANQRGGTDAAAVSDSAFNGIIGMWAEGGRRLLAHGAYAVMVGTVDRPGVARALAALLRGEWSVIRRTVPSLRGRLLAVSTIALRWRWAYPPVTEAGALRLRPEARC